jgi:hypothetical protein
MLIPRGITDGDHGERMLINPRGGVRKRAATRAFATRRGVHLALGLVLLVLPLRLSPPPLPLPYFLNDLLRELCFTTFNLSLAFLS